MSLKMNYANLVFDMKKLDIDIMNGDRFIKTLHYKYSPIFNLDLDEVEKFIREKVPTIRKGYKAILCGCWTNNYIYGREELTIRF